MWWFCSWLWATPGPSMRSSLYTPCLLSPLITITTTSISASPFEVQLHIPHPGTSPKPRKQSPSNLLSITFKATPLLLALWLIVGLIVLLKRLSNCGLYNSSMLVHWNRITSSMGLLSVCPKKVERTSIPEVCLILQPPPPWQDCSLRANSKGLSFGFGNTTNNFQEEDAQSCTSYRCRASMISFPHWNPNQIRLLLGENGFRWRLQEQPALLRSYSQWRFGVQGTYQTMNREQYSTRLDCHDLFFSFRSLQWDCLYRFWCMIIVEQ